MQIACVACITRNMQHRQNSCASQLSSDSEGDKALRLPVPSRCGAPVWETHKKTVRGRLLKPCRSCAGASDVFVSNAEVGVAMGSSLLSKFGAKQSSLQTLTDAIRKQASVPLVLTLSCPSVGSSAKVHTYHLRQQISQTQYMRSSSAYTATSPPPHYTLQICNQV